MLFTPANKIPHWVDIEALRKFSKLETAWSMGITILEWLFIISAIILHKTFSNPFIYVITIVIIGSRMYALYALMHDGIHYLIIGNKKLNDIFTGLFLAGPLFLSLHKTRAAHLDHHKYLKTGADPEMMLLQYSEYQFPMKRSVFLWILAFDILGVNFIKYFLIRKYYWIKSFLRGFPGSFRESLDSLLIQRISVITYYFILLVLIYWFGVTSEFIIYWLIPYMTIYQVLNRLRLSTEHFNIEENNPFMTRSVRPNLIEQIFLAPHNLCYHTEHHLYPSVPFYRLPKLSALLFKNEKYRESAQINKGYRDAMNSVF